MPAKHAVRRNLYGASPEALARLSAGARERHISQGEYVRRLLDLFDVVQYRADAFSDPYSLRALLAQLGLATEPPPMMEIALTDKQLRVYLKLPTGAARQEYLDKLAAELVPEALPR